MKHWNLKAHQLVDHYREQAEDIRTMLDTARATTTQQKHRARNLGYRSAAGDEQRLRHIPVHAPGVPGVIPGTNPLAETLRRERKLDTDR